MCKKSIAQISVLSAKNLLWNSFWLNWEAYIVALIINIQTARTGLKILLQKSCNFQRIRTGCSFASRQHNPTIYNSSYTSRYIVRRIAGCIHTDVHVPFAVTIRARSGIATAIFKSKPRWSNVWFSYRLLALGRTVRVLRITIIPILPTVPADDPAKCNATNWICWVLERYRFITEYYQIILIISI